MEKIDKKLKCSEEDRQEFRKNYDLTKMKI